MRRDLTGARPHGAWAHSRDPAGLGAGEEERLGEATPALRFIVSAVIAPKLAGRRPAS
jgi:hypothetical protein